MRFALTLLSFILTSTELAQAQNLATFQGEWSTDPKLCVADPANGPTILTISGRNIYWYEIDCDVANIKERSGRADMIAFCTKGGGAKSTGKASLQLMPSNRLQFSFQGPIFPVLNVFYKCQNPNSEKQNTEAWSHNGSEMEVRFHNSQREIRYTKPRAGMRSVGVAAGTLLFTGQTEGNQIKGTAFIFSKSCGPISYPVSGFETETRIEMTGLAPIVDARCNTKKTVPDLLIFQKVIPATDTPSSQREASQTSFSGTPEQTNSNNISSSNSKKSSSSDLISLSRSAAVLIERYYRNFGISGLSEYISECYSDREIDKIHCVMIDVGSKYIDNNAKMQFGVQSPFFEDEQFKRRVIPILEKIGLSSDEIYTYLETVYRAMGQAIDDIL